MRLYAVLIFILCMSLFGFSQETEIPDYYDQSRIEKKSISETDLETYKTDENFDYTETEAEENFMDRFKRWLTNILIRFWESIFGTDTASGFIYFVFRILPWLLLAGLFYLLIRFFLKVNSNAIVGNTQQKGQITLSEEEHIIKNEDIDALIKEAVAQKNYRLAIRYYYLRALKYLGDSNTIDWQPQKTNVDYINEIKEQNLKLNFENITRIYDYVWYGEFDVDALKFESLKLPFNTISTSSKNG